MNKTGIIILGIIFGPLIIFGIIKIISKLSGAVKIKPSVPKIGAGSIAIIFLICYGFYLLYINYYRPTPERLAFQELSRNPAENELRPEKKTLKSLNEKVKEEVWDWVFEWEASEQQMASGQMVKGRGNEAQLLSLSCDALVLDRKSV